MLVKRAAAGVHNDCCWIPVDSMARESLALAMVFSVQLQEDSLAAERGHLRIWIDIAVHPLAPAAPVGVHVDDDHPVSVVALRSAVCTSCSQAISRGTGPEY